MGSRGSRLSESSRESAGGGGKDGAIFGSKTGSSFRNQRGKKPIRGKLTSMYAMPCRMFLAATGNENPGSYLRPSAALPLEDRYFRKCFEMPVM